MDNAVRPAVRARGDKREACVAAALLACVVLVAFWEFMSNRSSRPFAPFALTAASFADFRLEAPGWRFQSLPVYEDPVEPNILAILVQPAGEAGDPVLVRLVHGYNMVDCMRIKGETVEMLADTRKTGVRAAMPPDASLPPGLQLWRLESSTGRRSLAATAMLRAGDFGVTDVSTRDMAFPRVGVPDDPNWWPQGITRESLRHPIASGRRFLRAKWNASRTDLLTFLGLRQPAWASEEMLTLVAASTDPSVEPDREGAVAARLAAAHQLVLRELQARAERGAAGSHP